jgi:hypothetical protein
VIREGLADDEGGIRALHNFVVKCIAEHDPIMGMSDDPQVLAVSRLVMGTPALVPRASRLDARCEELVAEELRGRMPDLVARITAAQIVGVLKALRERNLERLFAGESQITAIASAKADADIAFDILEHSVGRYISSPA